VTVIASLALATTRSRVPLISVFHGVQPSDYRRAGQVLDHCADHVVAVSDSLRVNLARAGMRRSDTHVIPNAVALPALPPRSAARRSLGLDPDVPVALCLARLVAQKRHDVLLRAWAQLEQHAVLLLAGDGDQRPAHERLARELGVASRVRFLGYRDDVPTLLAAADLTTLASDWEGLPMAVLESMGAGLPFVGTAVDGVREVVRPGEGALVPANDPDALTGALADLLFDAAACRNAGAAARRGVMARYDLNTMVTRYAQLVRVARARGGLDTESEHPGTGK
jgi:glycosyltransferase involved in cell wall biosynthesis